MDRRCPKGRELLSGARADVAHLERMVETAERTLSYHATHDPLTPRCPPGAPGRAARRGDRTRPLRRRRARDRPLGPRLEFKSVNDAVGREAATDAASRGEPAEGGVASRRLLARIGGDEFAALLGTVTTRKEAIEIAQVMRGALQPSAASREEQGVTASVGRPSPKAAPTPRRSCAPPTSRCTTPRRRAATASSSSTWRSRADGQAPLARTRAARGDRCRPALPRLPAHRPAR